MFPNSINWWTVSTVQRVPIKRLRIDGIYKGVKTVEMAQAENRFAQHVERIEVLKIKKLKRTKK